MPSAIFIIFVFVGILFLLVMGLTSGGGSSSENTPPESNSTVSNDEVYNEKGFNINNIHKNETRYDDDGYDINGYNRNGYNKDGFDKYGYDKEGYNQNGFDKNGFDLNGFNNSGYHKNGTFYDNDGYDRDGYNRDGYNRDGYDRDGYNRNGYNRFGGLCKEYTFNNKNVYNDGKLPVQYINDYYEDGYYVTFDPDETNSIRGKTYHTHLDCYKSWKQHMQLKFKIDGAWYKIKREDVFLYGLKKCKFCQKRDEHIITNKKIDKTLTKEYEKQLVYGKRVFHQKFGEGNIEHIDKLNDKIKVTFKSGTKEFILSTAIQNYLELIDWKITYKIYV